MEGLLLEQSLALINCSSSFKVSRILYFQYYFPLWVTESDSFFIMTFFVCWSFSKQSLRCSGSGRRERGVSFSLCCVEARYGSRIIGSSCLSMLTWEVPGCASQPWSGSFTWELLSDPEIDELELFSFNYSFSLWTTGKATVFCSFWKVIELGFRLSKDGERCK